MIVPGDYEAGYKRARQKDEALADNYIRHTTIGDPVMDALVEELAPLPQDLIHQFINAGMQEDKAGLRDAPEALREFFFTAPQPDPDWLDHDVFHPGIIAFQRNAADVLAAFVAGTLLVGFSTLISKSFVQTGRIFDNGVWRLRQNNRHMLEIFFPGGLERQGDGWKLSLRIRFIHAQVRRLLAQSEEWEHEAWGVPVSAAHMGFAVANFAVSTLDFSTKLGAFYTPEERAGFFAVWRYSGYVMGVPESILFSDENSATHLRDIGLLCEPPPTDESILMSNALINSAPLVAGIEDPRQRHAMVTKLIYPVSRALIGATLADQLRFPKNTMPLTLFLYRLDRRIKTLKAMFSRQNESTFASLLMVSAYDDSGLSYRLPDNVRAEDSRQW
ncbi:MAG: oxygenase MpaB family protein [Chloroflexota bacterium]|nr:oxygenase MpaB family protein [Chloroflexota bacterium]